MPTFLSIFAGFQPLAMLSVEIQDVPSEHVHFAARNALRVAIMSVVFTIVSHSSIISHHRDHYPFPSPSFPIPLSSSPIYPPLQSTTKSSLSTPISYSTHHHQHTYHSLLVSLKDSLKNLIEYVKIFLTHRQLVVIYTLHGNVTGFPSM